MYVVAFTFFFNIIGQITGSAVRWHHFDSWRHADKEGFLGVTVDMDSKQMSGEWCSQITI